MDDREIVTAIRARLADRIGQDRYEVWFGPTTQLSLRGENLVVNVPNQFFQDWLRSHFRKDLEASSLEAFGKPLALEFRIAQTLAATNIAHPAKARKTIKSLSADSATAPSEAPLPSVAATHAGNGEPSGIRRRAWATLDTFVVGSANCLAHKAAQLTVEKPGTYSPLLIHGPASTGKTHLLEGVCAAYRKAHPGAAVVYISAEQFTSYFLEALHGSGMPSFRRKYRDLALLAIDDLQFFKDKRATLVELLHTIETLLRSGRQLVLAADRPPAALKSLGPELMARLSGGMVCRVEAADYTMRCGIVEQQARRLGLTVPGEVVTFIASRFTSQSRELAGALKRLQAAALAHDRPLTLALAEEVLADLIDHQGRIVKLTDIDKAVCEVFGLDQSSLQSGGKASSVSHPRMLAMWLARKHTRAGLTEIGSYFGRRSHTTVISAQRRIESWMAGNASLKLADGALSLEETIRRVESQLRAG